MSYRNKKIVIVDYGMGNLFSLIQACEFLGVDPIISASSRDIDSADGLILPGVGAFRDAISNLNRNQSDDLNNDVTITLPDSLISGKLESANLKNLQIAYETEVIGTSNYQFNIQYPSSANSVTITLDISSSSKI